VYALGLVQAENPPPSSWQSNPVTPTLSVPVNEKLASAEEDGLGGLDVMDVSGGVVSGGGMIVQG
jgi:hypothetical protein